MNVFNPEHRPLYFVTDNRLTGGRPQKDVVSAALEGGVNLVQYRNKDLDDAGFLAEARGILHLCRSRGVPMLVNDRVHLAQEIGADGVHLGQDDMDTVEARRILGEKAIIGLSTHNLEEVLISREKPLSYINIGPMFPTATKDHSRYEALGLEKVLELSRHSRVPFTTMGGIKGHHLPELFNRGIRTVAMVTEISLAEDVAEKVRDLLREIRSAQIGSSSPPRDRP